MLGVDLFGLYLWIYSCKKKNQNINKKPSFPVGQLKILNLNIDSLHRMIHANHFFLTFGDYGSQ